MKIFSFSKVGEATDYGKLMLPPMIRLSGERLDTNGAYLMENGQSMVLWLGRGISSEFLQDIFGVLDLNLVDTQLVILFFNLNEYK